MPSVRRTATLPLAFVMCVLVVAGVGATPGVAVWESLAAAAPQDPSAVEASLALDRPTRRLISAGYSATRASTPRRPRCHPLPRRRPPPIRRQPPSSLEVEPAERHQNEHPAAAGRRRRHRNRPTAAARNPARPPSPPGGTAPRGRRPCRRPGGDERDPRSPGGARSRGCRTASSTRRWPYAAGRTETAIASVNQYLAATDISSTDARAAGGRGHRGHWAAAPSTPRFRKSPLGSGTAHRNAALHRGVVYAGTSIYTRD